MRGKLASKKPNLNFMKISMMTNKFNTIPVNIPTTILILKVKIMRPPTDNYCQAAIDIKRRRKTSTSQANKLKETSIQLEKFLRALFSTIQD